MYFHLVNSPSCLVPVAICEAHFVAMEWYERDRNQRQHKLNLAFNVWLCHTHKHFILRILHTIVNLHSSCSIDLIEAAA